VLLSGASVVSTQQQEVLLLLSEQGDRQSDSWGASKRIAALVNRHLSSSALPLIAEENVARLGRVRRI